MSPMYLVDAFRQEQGWELRIEGGQWVTHSETLDVEALRAVRRHLWDKRVPDAGWASITIVEQVYPW